jgi:formylglycine-generating enzyme required for sulfatase activity/energy-coupling factor transporter ATP-binding protein EcfA2
MAWNILLSAALEASLGVLAEAGFGDEARGLKERLTQRGEKARRGAFGRAYRRAVEAASEENLRPLLEHRPFQEKVITGLLDPETGFDLPALAAEQEDGLSPAQTRALRRFFAALENALLADETWGPLLERFQDLRFRRDVSAALQARRLDVPTTRLVSTLNAQLHGSGAIAQDQGVAATTGSVAVGGDVGRIVQVVIQQLTLGATPLPTGARPETLRHRYLKELARETDRLPWGSLEREYADPEGGESLGLAQVYTALDTTDLERVEHEADLRRLLAQMARDEARRVSAQAQVDGEPRLLILGDPGSGKSTFVNYLTHVLAQAGLAPGGAPWLARIAPWDHGPLLPVRVELRALAAQAGGRERGDARLLLDHLRRELETWQLGDFWPLLRGAIRDEKEALLFALDGLDEAPADLRGVVIETVQAFADRYPRHRYVVTCRPYAYVGQPRQLRDFRQVTLAPFNAEQVEHFVRTWYRELARRGRLAAQEAEERAGRLVQAVGRGDLWALAQRPLLLTVMTLLHTFRGQLPDDRTELYADAVDLLLRRWEGRLGREVGLVERLGMPDLKMSDLQAGLYAVAFRAHGGMEAAGGGTADVDEAELRQWLAPYLGDDWNKAGEFVDYIRERAGLLVRHKTRAYTFPHRTFQEFLAACYLVVESGDYAGQAANLVRADLDRWREVFVLAAGHAARTHRLGQAIAAVNALCPRDVVRVARPDAPALRQAALAGEALLEIGLLGVRREEAGRAALERVQDWLVAALQADRALEARERAGVGRVLARLGDPRPEVLRPEAMAFCRVPAGPFWMGSSDEDERAYDDEKPLHRVEIPYDYWLARYPVTVAQFRAFVEAEGFRPGDPDSLRDPDNHPVRWVNWHEARAFCAWLTRAWQEGGVLPRDWEARLPSEAEWEKGARGGIEIPSAPLIASVGEGLASALGASLDMAQNPNPQRRYPWGDGPDPNRANYDETGIRNTSAVGCFPGGASPYGCLDMAGNVWEWTSSVFQEYPYDPSDGRENLEAGDRVRRVLRGGAFLDSEWDSRCAYRGWYLPDLRFRYRGFRVVAAPSPPSLASGNSALGHSGTSALRREA